MENCKTLNEIHMETGVTRRAIQGYEQAGLVKDYMLTINYSVDGRFFGGCCLSFRQKNCCTINDNASIVQQSKIFLI